MVGIKKWYQSKTIWATTLAIILYVFENVFGIVPSEVPDTVVDFVQIVLMAIAFWGRVVATRKLEL